MTLKRKGLSRTEIIRRWNESSAAAASLSGGRKNIEFPNDCMEILIQHISEFGPGQSAFTDGKAPSKPTGTGKVSSVMAEWFASAAGSW